MLKGLKNKKDGKADPKKDKKDVHFHLLRNSLRKMPRVRLNSRKRTMEILSST